MAEQHLHTVLDWHRQGQFELDSLLILAELGFVAEQTGNLAGAKRFQSEGYKIAKDGGDPRAIALALEGLAGAHALAGDHAAAARLLGAATRTRESVGQPLPEAERDDVGRITAAATEVLGATGFAAEFRSGAESGGDAVAEGL